MRAETEFRHVYFTKEEQKGERGGRGERERERETRTEEVMFALHNVLLFSIPKRDV